MTPSAPIPYNLHNDRAEYSGRDFADWGDRLRPYMEGVK